MDRRIVQSAYRGWKCALPQFACRNRPLVEYVGRNETSNGRQAEPRPPSPPATVGRLSVVPGLWVAAGFSGHGFMQSPAVGAALAEWWLTGTPSLDLSALRLSRFTDRALERETAVF